MIPNGLKAMMAEAQVKRQEAEEKRMAEAEAERKRKEQEERERIEAEKRVIAEAQAAERRREEQAEAERKAKETAEIKRKEKEAEQERLQKLWRTLLDSRITRVSNNYENGWYLGQKENNTRHGLGMYYWKDTNFYIGSWKNGNFDGEGIYICPIGKTFKSFDDGVVYVGEWKDDKKHGIGAVYNKNGKQIFHGRFEADKPVEKYPPREEYSLGECRFEIIKYDNGNMYIGEVYKFDVGLMTQKHKLGKGFFIWADSNSSAVAWYGCWNGNGRKGYGMLISDGGKSITMGTWKDDKKV